MATESKSQYFHSLGELQADQEVEQALKDNPDWLQKQKAIEQAFKDLNEREQQKKKLQQRKDMSDGFRPKESDAIVDAPHYDDPRLEKPALQLPAFDKPQDYSIGKVPGEMDVDAPNSFLLAGIHEWTKDGVEAGKQIGEMIAKEDANVTSRPKDAFVREQSYMSEQATVDQAVWDQFGKPVDFNINRSAFPKSEFEELVDDWKEKLGLATTILKTIPEGDSPIVKELTKYYVTKQSTRDLWSRGSDFIGGAYGGRVSILEKKLKDGTLDISQILNLRDLEQFMDVQRIQNVFGAELQGLKKHNSKIDAQGIQDRLRTVFMAETQLGKQDKLGNLIDNPGGAVGLLQVEPSTFRDVVIHKQFGPKAANASGLTQKDLNIITNTPDNKLNTLSKYLKQPKVNYLAAAARILQYLKHHKL